MITIDLPPLRARKEDIPTLAEHFIAKYNGETGKHITGFSEEALLALSSYDWPGNIRELENCIERAVILTNNEVITPRDLYFFSHESPAPIPQASKACQSPRSMRSLKDVEKEHVEKVLSACDWHQTKAAQILEIDRKTLRNKIREFGLDKDDG